MSKRKLFSLVEQNHVSGWDDPRMPTISGMRRRGYSAQALRNFCDSLAVAKTDGVVDIAQLEYFVRDDLNQNAPRAMAVLKPIKVSLTNIHEADVLSMDVAVHPQNEAMGTRSLPFSKTLYIDAADFSEDTTLSRKKFKRLVLGDYVRLRGAYVIKAEDCVKNDAGEVVEIIASIVPNTVGTNPPEGIKQRGVIHWVSAEHCLPAKVHLYDRLFSDPAPDSGDKQFMDCLNADSHQVIDAVVEPSLATAAPELAYQFEREGYFCRDNKSQGEALVFNQTIGLRDNWAGK